MSGWSVRPMTCRAPIRIIDPDIAICAPLDRLSDWVYVRSGRKSTYAIARHRPADQLGRQTTPRTEWHAAVPSAAENRMSRLMRMSAMILVACAALAAQPAAVSPYEVAGEFVPANPIDACVLANLRAHDIQPTNLCSDAVFVRRVYLDVIGTLPTAQEVRAFLTDDSPDKRAALIDALLERGEFADYWALKWCDLLRVKSEFPINLWPNAVQAYHHWVRDAFANHMPYDAFVRELLTSSGSNFRVAPVNFYRAVQGYEPETFARAVALTFMGTRLESWPDEQRRDLVAFFSRVGFKSTAEWKEEIVYLDPAALTPLDVVFPDGQRVRVPVGQDPRRVFADWLITPDNEWFTRCAANRVWAWLMGRGIIDEPDDIRLDNPPSNPELLSLLQAELVRSDYDLRQLLRLILNSHTYQQSSIARCTAAEAAEYFAAYPVRRLDAEVLIDALNSICGSAEEYTSAIPEPFTHIPKENRTIALADGSISSAFLELFGRPARDTGLMSERNNHVSEEQRLHLLNSSHIQRKIEQSPLLRTLARNVRREPRQVIDTLYLTILSRHATPDEEQAAERYLRAAKASQEAANDLVWALLNSKEFQFRH